jgi:DNA-binding MarR family transcriptional regulator
MRFEGPPPEPLASALGFLLSWNGQRMASRFAQTLEPLGLRPPHFGVMTLIEAHPGATQQQLVDDSLIDPSSMVAVIDELEGKGLAERREHPDDRRKHAIHLTQKGKRTLDRARRQAIAMTEDALAPLTGRERDTLRTLLRKLAGLQR